MPIRSRTMLAGSLVLGLVSLAPRPGHAVELLYNWKAGEVHRFRLEEHSRMQLAGMVTAGMPGMPGIPGAPGGATGLPGSDMTAHVTATFSEKVQKVRSDGTAEMELTVEELIVAQGDGKPVSALGALPAAARKVKAEVDRKGHARFFRMLTVYQVESRFVLGGYATAGRGGASASASATGPDGQTIEVYGSIDARTGKVTAGARAKAPDPVTRKAVQVKAEDPGVEVIPRRIFELMVLPDGDMTPGSTVEVANPLGKVRVSCDPVEGSVAPIRFATVAAASTPAAGDGSPAGRGASAAHRDPAGEGDGDDQADGQGAPEGMAPSTGMGGMPSLGGMPGAHGAHGAHGSTPGGLGVPGPGAGAVTSAMRMTLDVLSHFDVAAGRLLDVRGRMSTAMGGGDGSGLGAGVKVDTDLVLGRVGTR